MSRASTEASSSSAVDRPAPRKGRWLSGHSREFRADRLGFLARCAREHDGPALLRFGRRSALLASDPDSVRDVLSEARSGRLIEADEDARQFWRIEPDDGFAARTLEIVERIDWATEDWRVGQIRDVWAEMSELAGQIFPDAPSCREVTANTLAWAWQLLARDPEMDAAIWDESLRIVGERMPKPEDADRLQLTQSAITETRRLFPPRWLIRMTAASGLAEPIAIAGHPLDSGTEVWISPWAIHRDPKRYDDPEGFLPERWQDDPQGQRANESLPFGPGPWSAIGEPRVRRVVALALATVCRRFRFALDVGWKRPRPEPRAILRPENGVRVLLKSRFERWGR